MLAGNNRGLSRAAIRSTALAVMLGASGLTIGAAPLAGAAPSAGTETGTGTGTPRPRQQAPAGICPKEPPGGLQLNPRFPPPPHPKKPDIVNFQQSHACAFITGYANVRKLKGSAFIPPGLSNVATNVRTIVKFGDDYAQVDSVAVLDFHGKREFPPSKAAFLSFGFVPTTATMQLIEHGTINIFAVGTAATPPPLSCKPNRFRTCASVTSVFSRLSVRIVPGSVSVNGVPLDVGAHCETPAFDSVVTGSSATKPAYDLDSGGPLLGEVTIPRFRHCGSGENLDLIFNAAISGRHNFTLLTQGKACFVIAAVDCGPNRRPAPRPAIRKVTG